MADAMMMPGAMAPEPPPPSIDQLAAFEQMRQQISPTEVTQELLGAAEQADPIAVAEFKRELASLNVAPEVIDMLRTMVDEVLADPANYLTIRQKYLAMGVDEELLPEAFDAAIFAALNMALDQLGSQGMGEPMPMAPPQAFARGGIASLRPMAREMAAAGRNGDTMLAHISPVEAQILRRYGGSGTINPVTGAPEYSLKSMFKKIGKAVKKFASTTIGKIVIGTALFMVAGPAAAGMLGATAGSAVSAGISGFVSGAGTTLLAGGNLKQALKAGAVGGLTAGVAKGVMNRVAPPKLPPGTATTAPAVNTAEGLQRSALPPLGPTAQGATPSAFAPSSPLATPPSLAMTPFEQSIKQGLQQSMTGGPAPMATAGPTLAGGFTPPPIAQAASSGGGGAMPSFVDKTLDRVMPSRIQAAAQPAAEQAYVNTLARTKSETLAMRAYEQALPGMRAYLPMAGLGIAALGAMGGFEEQPSEVPPGFEGMVGGQGASGVELLAKYPEKYGLVPGPTQVTYAPVTPAQLFSAGRPQAYASGGQAQHYPRKNGAIDGPGTATSDSIPAMLSDGEFVFTAKSVRAMGDGSRRKGAKRMYALMRKLEGRANG